MATPNSPVWSSRFAFYLATIGASVGLGSIWRLPYQVGSNGGSAFVVVFTIACLVIATPLLVAEFIIGRRSHRNPPEAAGVVAAESGLSRRWNAIGVLGTVAVFAMISPYTVVAGWVLAYAWKCASGSLAGLSHAEVAQVWRTFLASPFEMGAWHLVFLLAVGLVSARGVNRGIEVANRLRAPLLLALLLILAGYGLWNGDARAGLRFAFVPDFGALSAKVLLAAIGQAFYATGVGAAMMLAYGSYVDKGASLFRAALVITGSILLVSLLATLTIFPLVFGYGMNPAQGPELVFDVLATVFAEMPGGRFAGTLFFVALVVAAITPVMAGFEPAIAWIEQRWAVSRVRAVVVAFALAWMLCAGSILSFHHWATWYPLGFVPGLGGRTVFDLLDFLPSNILLPLGALMTSIFVGWRLRPEIVDAEMLESGAFARRWVIWALRWICPIAILIVLVAALR
jgi:NSS family neurotransmitter:Na+ symporter